MIINFQRYTKLGIIAGVSLLLFAIAACVLSIVCNFYPLLAYMDGIRGKRVYYNLDERSQSDYATTEAFAESGIELRWENTDAMTDYFYPRYKSYNAVMSKFLTRSIGATWESKIASRASEIFRRDSAILSEINLDSITEDIPESRQIKRRYAEIESKKGDVYKISVFGWRSDIQSTFLICKINYDTATNAVALLTKQITEIRN